MTKKEIIQILQKNQDTIQKYGVRKMALFGSASRDEISASSDIDFIVQFEDNRGGMQDFIGLIDFLESIFHRKVDVLTPGGVESIRIKYIKESIKKETEYVLT